VCALNYSSASSLLSYALYFKILILTDAKTKETEEVVDGRWEVKALGCRRVGRA
jgi:hypothetical protein